MPSITHMLNLFAAWITKTRVLVDIKSLRTLLITGDSSELMDQCTLSTCDGVIHTNAVGIFCMTSMICDRAERCKLRFRIGACKWPLLESKRIALCPYLNGQFLGWEHRRSNGWEPKADGSILAHGREAPCLLYPQHFGRLAVAPIGEVNAEQHLRFNGIRWGAQVAPGYTAEMPLAG
jgi:hypothetical protein